VTNSLIITGGGLSAVITATLLLRRYREKAARVTWARSHGWAIYPHEKRDLARRLRGLKLMQIGHSRRLLDAFRGAGPSHLFFYVCESGFENRRRLHYWMVAACEVDHGRGRAIMTAQRWLLEAATMPALRRMPLRNPGQAEAGAATIVAAVQDPEAWSGLLNRGLDGWLRAQGPDRNWEVLPGFVVGYQMGDHVGETVLDLARATAELAGQVARSSDAVG